MAVKVFNKDLRKAVKCPRCGAVTRYKDSEVRRIRHPYNYYRWYEKAVVCYFCQQPIEIK